MSPRLRPLLAILAAALAPAAPSSHATPVSRPIVVDGQLDDWTEVLASPDNVARDGDGSSLACAYSTDRDCPIAQARTDLSRFAWTWDDTGFAFLLERFGPSNPSSREHAWIYFDEDHDGLMESGEAVLHLDTTGQSADGITTMEGYLPETSGGDPLVDPLGIADGWKMPGRTSSGGGSASPLVVCDVAGGTRCEGLVAWGDLGVVPGAPMQFRVAIGATGTLPSGADDTLAGVPGAGDTGFRGVRLDGPRTIGALPGTTVSLRHAVTSSGNLGSRLGVRASSSSGLDLTWLRDYDGDGVAETLLAIDAGGDASFGTAADFLAPEADTDGDGAFDTGLLGAGKDARLEILLDVPAGARGMKETVSVESWVTEHPALRAAVTDVVRAGTVTLARDETRPAVAGDVAWVPHVVSENAGEPALAGFSFFSVRGWRWEAWLDPNGDGDPADAVRLSDLDGDGRADLPLDAGETRHVFASATVPPSALIGTTETVIARLHLGGGIESTVTDRVAVSPPLDVAPNHLLADGRARYGGEGEPLYFAHRITNATGRLNRFRVEAACDAGWPVTILLDPDGDGRPADAVPASSPLTVPVSGGSVPVLLRVQIPDAGRTTDQARVTLTATAFDDARVTATALDDAVVALVRVHDDPAATFNVSVVASCGTAYAAATGLGPSSPGFRFAWRNPSGLVVQLQDVASDASGRCQDAFALRPEDAGPGYSVEIQQWDGMGWTLLDRATFAVGDEVEMEAGPTTPETAITGGIVEASVTAFNASFDQTVTADIAWRLVSPDGTTILGVSGAFVAFTGAEVTRIVPASLRPRDVADVVLSLRNLDFPMAGPWRLDAARVSSCGGKSVIFEAIVVVRDDADKDGLERLDELALGTDPLDGDTDDDGLADGAEGAGDADADGAPDALECDADGDGLPDGLESGVTTPLDGTDVSAGCFRADADPSSATDPRDADSDDGGVPDGVEDADADGARDLFETDALEAGDDWPACSRRPPPEIGGLRAVKAGAEAARLTWERVDDPCVAYVVEAADLLQLMTPVSTTLGETSWTDVAPMTSFVRYYLVRGDSWLGGRGPNGL